MRKIGSFIAALSVAYAAPLSAQDIAGITTKVQQDAFQKTGFSPEALYQGDSVFREASLYTAEYGSLDVRLNDGTKLRLSPNSRIKVDRYVYDPGAGSGEVLVDLGKGALRYVSGRVRKERVSLRTQVATIGIRGTEFTLEDTGTGSLNIWLDDGAITASPFDTDQSFDFEAPAFAVCTSSGCTSAEPPDRPSAYPDAGSGSERDGGGGDSDGGGDNR